MLLRAPPGSNLSLSAPEGTRIRGVRFLHDGSEVPALELPLHRAARTGEKIENVQLDLVLDDGKLHHLLATAHPIRDASGAVRGAVGAYVDVSAERRGEVSVLVSTSPDGTAVLDVQDDGKGIDAATMERIFDPFFTTRDVGHGMGLGLPVCHAIVAAPGGTLTATSAPDKGSTFRVELPAADTHPGSIGPGTRV